MKTIYTLLIMMFCVAMQNTFAQTYTVTFNVNMANVESISTDGVYLAGGGDTCFGNPGSETSYELTDPDMDGVYSATIEVDAGFTCYYTFTNGICLPNWECKENIAGQDCANPDNFNDRLLEDVQADMEINTCFGSCTDDGSCPSLNDIDVTFNVSVANEEFVEGDVVYITGELPGDGWCGSCIALEDPDNDQIYSTTITLPAGQYQYKYTINGWGDQGGIEEGFTGEEACTTGPGEFVNRVVEVDGNDPIVLDAYCFNTCDVCEPVEPEMAMVTFKVDMSQVTDAFTTPEVNGEFEGWSGGTYPMTDLGDGIWEATVELVQGQTYEYKYAADAWTISETLMADTECTITDGDFTNRVITVGTEDTELDVVCWASCEACIVSVEEIRGVEINVYPNPVTSDVLNIEISSEEKVIIINSLGENVLELNIVNGQATADVSELESGTYFIKSATGMMLSKFVVVK